MTFKTLTLADALQVSCDLRCNDREGITALLGGFDPEVFAMMRWQTNGPAWSLHHDGRPVAIGGVEFVNGWTGVFWMAAVSDITSESWRKLIRHTRIVVANITDPTHENFKRRVEAITIGGWDEAERFAQSFGFSYEGTKIAAGSRGEDLKVWAIAGPARGAVCR